MRELKFAVRQTGYDHEDTDFLVTCKDRGTAPDLNVYQSGQYEGHLTLSDRGAWELVKSLCYFLGKNIPTSPEKGAEK